MQPTIEELEKIYNKMYDYQLLDLAADIQSLRPDAIKLLQKILKKRGLKVGIDTGKSIMEPEQKINSQRISKSELKKYNYLILAYVLILMSGVLNKIAETMPPGLWFCVFVLLPVVLKIHVNNKRCHDMGKSGFYQLHPFHNLYEEGDIGENKYGAPPIKK